MVEFEVADATGTTYTLYCNIDHDALCFFDADNCHFPPSGIEPLTEEIFANSEQQQALLDDAKALCPAGSTVPAKLVEICVENYYETDQSVTDS